jgi:hypothetical protein
VGGLGFNFEGCPVLPGPLPAGACLDLLEKGVDRFGADDFAGNGRDSIKFLLMSIVSDRQRIQLAGIVRVGFYAWY